MYYTGVTCVVWVSVNVSVVLMPSINLSYPVCIYSKRITYVTYTFPIYTCVRIIQQKQQTAHVLYTGMQGSIPPYMLVLVLHAHIVTYHAYEGI